MEEERVPTGPLGSRISNCVPPGDGDFLDLGDDGRRYESRISLFILLDCFPSTDEDLGGGG